MPLCCLKLYEVPMHVHISKNESFYGLTLNGAHPDRCIIFVKPLAEEYIASHLQMAPLQKCFATRGADSFNHKHN